MCLQMVAFEWWSFEIVGFAAGSLGEESLASHNILATITPFVVRALSALCVLIVLCVVLCESRPNVYQFDTVTLVATPAPFRR